MLIKFFPIFLCRVVKIRINVLKFFVFLEFDKFKDGLFLRGDIEKKFFGNSS